MYVKTDLLRKVERGEISAEEAVRLLDEQREDFSMPEEETAPVSSQKQNETADDRQTQEVIREQKKFTRWWLLPFTIGFLLTILGSVWMYLGIDDGKLMAGFWLAWIPFVSGITLMAVSWRARASYWIHLRVKGVSNEHFQNINISFPFPFGLIKWVRSTFGKHFPKEVRGIDLDDLMVSIKESVTVDNPIYLWVDEDTNQQQVEIWIGRTAE